jgi:hypothetical protein
MKRTGPPVIWGYTDTPITHEDCFRRRRGCRATCARAAQCYNGIVKKQEPLQTPGYPERQKNT